MKKILSLLLVIAVSMTIVGCGSSDKEVLKIQSGLWSKPEEQQYIRENIIPAFEAEYDVEVEFEVVAATDIKSSLEAQKGSGKWTSDLVIIHSGDMPMFISEGYIKDITDVKEGLDVTFLDAFNESTQVDGKDYFLPISADVYLVIANKDALQYLPAGVNEDLSNITWDNYVDWANAIAEGEGTPKTFFPAKTVASVVYQLGGIGLSYGGSFPEFSSDGALQAWEQVLAMRDAIHPDSYGAGDPAAAMKDESSWLSFHHMGPVGDAYQSAPAKFVVAPAPAGPAGNGSIAGAWGLGITEGSDNAELAAKFMEYFTSAEVLYDAATGVGGMIPPVVEVVDQLGASAGDKVISKGLETLENGVVSGVPGSEYTDWGAVKAVYDEVFAGVWEKDITSTSDLQAALAKAQADLEALKK